MEYKISLMKNAFYAQSGGVTSVINCSAYGLFNGFKKQFSNSNIFVGKTVLAAHFLLAIPTLVKFGKTNLRICFRKSASIQSRMGL